MIRIIENSKENFHCRNCEKWHEWTKHRHCVECHEKWYDRFAEMEQKLIERLINVRQLRDGRATYITKREWNERGILRECDLKACVHLALDTVPGPSHRVQIREQKHRIVGANGTLLFDPFMEE